MNKTKSAGNSPSSAQDAKWKLEQLADSCISRFLGRQFQDIVISDPELEAKYTLFFYLDGMDYKDREKLAKKYEVDRTWDIDALLDKIYASTSLPAERARVFSSIFRQALAGGISKEIHYKTITAARQDLATFCIDEEYLKGLNIEQLDALVKELGLEINLNKKSKDLYVEAILEQDLAGKTPKVIAKCLKRITDRVQPGDEEEPELEED